MVILVFYYLLLVHYLLAVDHTPDRKGDGILLLHTEKPQRGEKEVLISGFLLYKTTKTNHEHAILWMRIHHTANRATVKEKPDRRL